MACSHSFAEHRFLSFSRSGWRLSLAGFLLLTGSALSAQSIRYDKLSDCQRDLFGTFHKGSTTPGQVTWLSLEDSQRLEYTGGTQALNTILVPPPPCHAMSRLLSVDAIWGNLPNRPSADQFHLDVKWSSGADGVFKGIPGWDLHIAWLHPGQYGFQENRDGNPFLGLVVLFGSDKPQQGQFHIGFRSAFAHYVPNNGNIAKNYKKYCAWYGRIDGYTNACPPAEAQSIWSSGSDRTLATDNIQMFPNSDLQGTVRAFLNEWYIQRSLDRLVDKFLAEDNAARTLTERGLLPNGVSRSYWSALFSQAFEDGLGAMRFEELSQVITYKEPALPKFLGPLKYVNETPTNDHFAILAPNSIAENALFPTDGRNPEEMDTEAGFLAHLKELYRLKDPEHNRLNVVVYTTTAPGLLHEAVVLYWIQENGAWKLAAFQGTD
jgi:hypothetical protein